MAAMVHVIGSPPLSNDHQQQIQLLRERIGALMKENDALELSDQDLAVSEQRIRANLDLISSLATQVVALEKLRQE
jgi:hypothetical protein